MPINVTDDKGKIIAGPKKGGDDTEREKGLKKSKMLIGGQAKLDKNKNNKIDAEDFKLLRAGKKRGGVMKAKRGGFRLAGKDFSERMKNVEKGLINKKTGKPTSMAAMRELKGFKPGELPKEFNARRMALAGVKEGVKRTRIGKIALGVAGAGLAAKAFLDKKKKEAKEKKQNKKMGGGMMQLPTGYNKGGGADSGTAGKTKKGPGLLGGAKGKKAQKGPRPGGRPSGRPRPSAGPMGAPPKEDKGFELKYPGPARPGNPVVVYSVNKGSMVKARGGGLAKTKPTKMY